MVSNDKRMTTNNNIAAAQIFNYLLWQKQRKQELKQIIKDRRKTKKK